jgi:hypothetical protein
VRPKLQASRGSSVPQNRAAIWADLVTPHAQDRIKHARQNPEQQEAHAHRHRAALSEGRHAAVSAPRVRANDLAGTAWRTEKVRRWRRCWRGIFERHRSRLAGHLFEHTRANWIRGVQLLRARTADDVVFPSMRRLQLADRHAAVREILTFRLMLTLLLPHARVSSRPLNRRRVPRIVEDTGPLAELADATDSKSVAHKACGFESHEGHRKRIK